MEPNIDEVVFKNLILRSFEKAFDAPDPETHPTENIRWWEENHDRLYPIAEEYAVKIMKYLNEEVIIP